MTHRQPISWLTIKGYKSIQDLPRFKLNDLNVLIGANGAGKSNLVSYFRMLGEMVEGRLQNWTTQQGSADRVVSFGVKETSKIESFVEFGLSGYQFELEPTIDGGFMFANEALHLNISDSFKGLDRFHLGSGQKNSALKETIESDGNDSLAALCYRAIVSWKVYHFHDTSDTAGVKRVWAVHDNEYLRPDASNLAAFLYRLRQTEPSAYQQIRQVVQLAIPFFDDFVLKPQKLPTEEEQIRLLWKQRDSDYPFWPSQLSDGSIRFICLATALLQPASPSTIIIDEPELGLHPYAIALLASLLRSASKRMQVIVSTQSVPLVNEFSIDDLIIVEREQNATVFKRYNEKDFKSWLEEYSVGELWEKNILGGRPVR
jgi:predicted ATPase